uniref:NFD4 C-terminal domain-containing protein n=1 Tax=Aegilops tauschii subsp. strangulata TaxID=200361 RepID=A0A453QX26_AEGTS
FRSVPRKVTSAAADNDFTEPFLLPSSSEPNFGKIEDEDAADIDLLLAEGEGAVKQKRRRPKRGEDFRFREALLKADFWLLFAVFFIGVGSGVTVLNNLAQVGTAAGVVGTTISVSLFSLGNFFGRLGGGAVSDYFVRVKDTSTDSTDHMHPSGDDSQLPSLRAGSQGYALHLRCHTRRVLWRPFLGDGVDVIGAVWAKAVWEDLQLHLAGEPTWRARVQQPRWVCLRS